MKPIKKEDIDQKVFDIYDEYVHSKIDRRQFVERLSLYTAGGITVSGLMNFLLPNYVQAKRFDVNDTRFDASYIKYESPKGAGEMKALLTRPKGISDKLPGIVVVHENRGLNPYIEDVAHQCALDGFVAIAPDALTPFGGYPGTDDEGRTLQAKRNRDEMLEDFIAAFEYLKNHPDCNGNIGVVGFCFGGWISNMMAVKLPDLKAAVPYYGGQATADEVPSIQAPIQLHFAALDTRVNAGWDDYKTALEKHDKAYEVYFYEDLNHGFHNHSTPRYDEAGAKLAWERTIRFFREKLV
ncbi:dienelactone hydrolase family protein [Belliella sp. DSM 111904]|uniref:Dienelactone hydrolase family protein n=1 Tax=Belliella filtrata TaxID=2923435 RepID=A0ABS9UZL8_9BACT|nr:dienelactone hydrolase family protein [Belliella filtrata]MCH7409419.1 dienelactone hydrolase family protein [Belliella filtrata]